MASYVVKRAALVDTKLGGVVASTVRINVGITGTVEVAPSACVRVVVNSGTVVAAFVFTNSTVVAGIGVADSVVKGVAVSSSAGKSVNSIDITDAVADGDGVFVSVSRREDVVAAAVSANSTVANRTRSVAAGIVVAVALKAVVAARLSAGKAVESTASAEAIADGVFVSISRSADVVAATFVASSAVANWLPSAAAGTGVANSVVEGVAASSSAGKSVNSIDKTDAVADGDGVYVSVSRREDVVAAAVSANSTVTNRTRSDAAGIAVADPAVEGAAVPSSTGRAVESTGITEVVPISDGESVSASLSKDVAAATVVATSAVANFLPSVAARIAVADPAVDGSAVSSSAGKAVESTAVTEVVADGDSVSISTSLRADVVSATFVASFAVANWLPSAAAGTGVADSVVEGVVVASTAITEAIAVGEGVSVSVPRRTDVIAAAVSANSIVANRTRSVAAGIAVSVALKAVVAVSSSAGKAVESTAVTEVVADGDSVSISTSLRADVVSATFVASFAVANWLPSAAAGTGVADSVVEGVVVASTAITEAIAVGEGVSVSVPRRTAVVAADVSTNSIVANRTRSVAAGIAVAVALKAVVAVGSSAGKAVESTTITEAIVVGEGINVSVLRRTVVVGVAVAPCSGVANRTRSVVAGIAVADPAVEGVAVPSSTGRAVESTGITEVVPISDGVSVSASLSKDVAVATVVATSAVANFLPSVAARIAVADPAVDGSAVSSSAGKAVESTAVTEVVADGDSVSISTSLRADVVSATFVASFAVANWLPSAAAGTGVADSVVEGVAVASTAITEAIAVGEGVSVSVPRRTDVVGNAVCCRRNRRCGSRSAVAAAGGPLSLRQFSPYRLLPR